MIILFIGDIVGHRGRQCVVRLLPALRAEYRIDLVIANAENAAGGLGATPTVINELYRMGVQAITLGNHVWRKKELAPALNTFGYVVRPANFPEGIPGKGSMIVTFRMEEKLGL
jgi:2',3'-cyclic-nucleotide 2'-phosphodiesterase